MQLQIQTEVFDVLWKLQPRLRSHLQRLRRGIHRRDRGWNDKTSRPSASISTAHQGAEISDAEGWRPHTPMRQWGLQDFPTPSNQERRHYVSPWDGKRNFKIDSSLVWTDVNWVRRDDVKWRYERIRVSDEAHSFTEETPSVNGNTNCWKSGSEPPKVLHFEQKKEL